MKTLLLTLALTLSAALASAQTAINNTTLTANVTATETTISLAATTCTSCTFGAGTLLYIDSEAMLVTGAYSSGLVVPVIRGANGTAAAAHGTYVPPYGTNVIYYGPPERFKTVNPPAGRCQRVEQPYLPWINTANGLFWLCDNYNWRSISFINQNGTAPSR